jgi:hypothetical protein
MVTPTQRKALNIIRDHPIDSPRQFARFMWPDSERWKNHTKAGPNGVVRGGGMSLAGGGYLGRLCKFLLTEAGRQALVDAQKV